jgi:predicted GIY-YIG superfamily endonuclease
MVRKGFTSRYLIDRLIYFEETNDVHAAIAREKQVKGWTRAKKIELIDSMNPKWEDLSVKLGLVTAEMLRSFWSHAETSTPHHDNRRP